MTAPRDPREPPDDATAAARREAEAARELSDVDHRTARAMIEALRAEYGIDPDRHRRHHEWTEARMEQCSRARELGWTLLRELARWGVLLGAGVVLLALLRLAGVSVGLADLL